MVHGFYRPFSQLSEARSAVKSGLEPIEGTSEKRWEYLLAFLLGVLHGTAGGEATARPTLLCASL